MIPVWIQAQKPSIKLKSPNFGSDFIEDIKLVCEQDKRRGEILDAVLGLARAIGGEQQCSG